MRIKKKKKKKKIDKKKNVKPKIFNELGGSFFLFFGRGRRGGPWAPFLLGVLGIVFALGLWWLDTRSFGSAG
jgi:hypothetical protein